ncbi:MAG: 2-aminoethylphosphonate--pyruvate transaminase [Pirellulaceae bacterium]|nr:2-aminoethylphosphonate--pyruvate transaminase [Pirellulaceae bacterium]
MIASPEQGERPRLLLTPGPLTTSRSVRQAMLQDHGTWDRDYHALVNGIRRRLHAVAGDPEDATVVLMQGSGTFCIEATVGSVLPPDGKLLVVDNGAYGRRIVQIAQRLKIDCRVLEQPETQPADLEAMERILKADRAITHVALVHCETTTGLLNPAAAVGRLCREFDKVFVLDAMSSLGGLPFTMQELGAHFLVSSANKCLQGVPGIAFALAHRPTLERTAGWARSIALDLFDQWREMEGGGGKWRYTSPTHVVAAFAQALAELDAEGGVLARYRRYCENHEVLVAGMSDLGFRTLVAREHQSPIITSFVSPADPRFSFAAFYDALKDRGFLLYPGKVSRADTFRIGTIGHVFPEDMRRLIRNIGEVLSQWGLRLEEAKETTS